MFKCGDFKIFGGAVRDSIADMPINDIDIICGPVTAKKLHNFIESKGYTYNISLVSKDLIRIYSELRCINEPKTYIKNNKIIQVIRPVNSKNELTTKDTKEHIDYMIENVDISCCGVSYDGVELKENYKNSIIHCLCKICYANPFAVMSNNNRLPIRKHKLIERGWTFFETEEEGKKLIRERNLKQILNNN